ncbi:mannose-P-dolichol utilization defect 1 protein [Strongylocentrotus purpuratus]|uniref:Mannose-P-dolichol utilization defect 1 protein homolog n=1 Tax=Strongylocentrotus purpuratus TaxID=7668 RepID=A0A7M7HIY1_STRPU|nr:mannose-P-dolichol utilization defect 1 protein [Strongylocentrotus purpuratus]|eukprot:XP_011671587.1 PREDICTED: mannose-P-dolichol utilization defect 1 protein [Strongylocentrotus purpuratus]
MEVETERTGLFPWLVMLLLPEDCYITFFEDFNFLDIPCLKVALSKGLGLGIIAGSLMVKLPQIGKILASKSGEGLNVLAVLLELAAISSSWAYSFANSYPFSAWGEALFLAVQTVTIAFLCMLYNGNQAGAVSFLLSYLGIMYVLLSGLTPMSTIAMLQAGNMPIVIVSKLIQAYTNFSNGHTGQLSAVTVFLLTAGSLARIFTSVQETNDPMLVWTYIVASTCNSIITLQLVWYWGATKEYLSRQQSKKAE